MTRLHDIQSAVQALSAPRIESETDDFFWYSVDRNYPDYYRLAPNSFDVAEPAPVYDLWLDVDATFDRAGFLQVRAAVVLYNCRLEVEEERVSIFGDGFDGYDQPREQMFLINIPTYQEKINRVFRDLANAAEMWAPGDVAEV